MKYETGIETRNFILKVSKQLFLKKGFHETGIREIAQEAEISSGTLYKHFKNKEDILATIVQPYIDRWNQINREQWDLFEGQLQQVKNDKQGIIDLIHENNDQVYLDLVEENLPIWTFIFFRSEKTRYQGFLDNLIQWQMTVALRILDLVYPGKEYLNHISKKQLNYIVESQVLAIFNTFKLDLEKEERHALIESVMGVYKLFWEDLFSKGPQ